MERLNSLKIIKGSKFHTSYNRETECNEVLLIEKTMTEHIGVIIFKVN